MRIIKNVFYITIRLVLKEINYVLNIKEKTHQFVLLIMLPYHLIKPVLMKIINALKNILIDQLIVILIVLNIEVQIEKNAKIFNLIEKICL